MARPNLKPGVKVKERIWRLGLKSRGDGVIGYGPSSGRYYDPEDDTAFVNWNNGDSGWIDAHKLEVIS